MQIVKCAKCRKKIFKYHKIGKGKLLRCWLERIVSDYSVKQGLEVKCECGNLIGNIEGKYVKMKSSAFTRSGKIAKK